MADARLTLLRGLALVAALTLAPSACDPPPVVAPPRIAPAPITTSFEDAKVGRFTSKRQQLVLPLPDGHAWRIDDHKQTWLVATHAASQSELAVRVWSEDARANTKSCEEAARLRRKLIERDDADVVRRAEVDVPHGFDTRLEVVVKEPKKPGEPIRAGLLAFGGRLHRCFAYVYTTEARGDGAATIVGARLAAMLQRSLRAIVAVDELDPGRRLEGEIPVRGAPQ